MKPRTTGILLAIVLVLGGLVYFYELRGGDARREAEDQLRRLFTEVDADAIEWISLTTSDGVDARVERRDGDWMVVSPVVFPADRFAVDGIASNLATLVSDSEFENPQALAEYGLGESARVIRFSLAGTEHELRLGGNTPVGSRAYASTDASNAVYTIETYKARSFDKALNEIREKRVLDFDPDAIQKIEAHWPEGSVVLERARGEAEAPIEGGSAEWRITSPIRERADVDTLDDLLADLSFLRANGFVDAPSAGDVKGFETPVFDVWLTSEPGPDGEETTAPLHLTVGGSHDGDLLVRTVHDSLYRIASNRLEDFPRELMAYRFKELANFSIGDAERVELFFQQEAGDPVAISASKDAGQWTSSPEAMVPDMISDLVSTFSRLRAETILADEVGQEELSGLGLSPPNAALSVFGAPADDAAVAALLTEIHIGQLDVPEGIVARVAGSPIIYRLDYELADQIPISLDAFRNRFVALEENEVEQGAAFEVPAVTEDFLSPTQESP